MTDFDVRLTLKQHKAEPSVIRVATLNKWDLRLMGNRKAEVYVDKWVTPDGRTEIHYVEDPLTGLPFVTVRGNGAEEAARVLREGCDVWENAEALAEIETAGSRDDRLTAVYATAFTAPGAQVDAVVDVFRALAQDPDPGIRQSVVVATGYLPWPGLVELVRELADSDPADHVRHNAGVLLEGLELHGDIG
ncbi:HEAT repeat domain-containing protein [Streptomyces canus]|jgi:hypothetical protein|uniref:HEAT repeat domain-containing protein n=1 Tax=Streptomyces canus TaxID=58343 RepID=UPI00371DA704